LVKHSALTIVPIHFPTVRAGDELADLILNGVRRERLRLRSGDIVAVASKIVSTCEARYVKLEATHVTRAAKHLAARWRIDERLAAIVTSEADRVVGGVNGFLLTIKNGFLVPNAGVDLKNSPPGTAMLWPRDPDRSARELRRILERRYNNEIGVEIIDSHVTPLRLGTVGLAIGVSGFVPVLDHRGLRDIFGRRIRVTQANVADDVASAAHLLMGENAERIGAVLVRGVAVSPNARANGESARLSLGRCLVGNNLKNAQP